MVSGNDSREKLIALLQLAYSGELAAAHAYRGHWHSVHQTVERQSIRKIEEDEWRHRKLVGEMLAGLGAGPSKRREIRAANRPEAEMDALFREEEKHDTAQLNEGPHAGKVGAFEGANYEARGYYRPQADCIMFTRDNVPFCAVCRRAIAQILDLYAR